MSQPQLKSSPVGEKDPRVMMKPPAIIPLQSIPQHIMAQFQVQAPRVGQPMILHQPGMPGQQFNPQFMRLPQDINLVPQHNIQHRIPNFLSAPAALGRGSSPEDDDEEEGNIDVDSRHHRRREMNRIAQQKSRKKKDELIANLQMENDQLKARIISLDAEVKVWKNMTKKSENDANELRKRLEESRERYDELRRARSLVRQEEARNVAVANNFDEEEEKDGLKIYENVEENLEQAKVEPVEVEKNIIMETDSRVESMMKEIQGLTVELQRMYTVTTQQNETNRLLHQALEDQEKRISMPKQRKERDPCLEICPVQQISVAPAKKKNGAGIRWMKRNVSRGRISRSDIEKHKVISKIMKKNVLR